MNSIFNKDNIQKRAGQSDNSLDFVSEDAYNLNIGYLAHFYRCQFQYINIDIAGEYDMPESFKHKRKILKQMYNLLEGKFLGTNKYRKELDDIKKGLSKIQEQKNIVFKNYTDDDELADERLLEILSDNFDKIFISIVNILERDGMLTKKFTSPTVAMGDMS
jgi:hypothetical protein